MTSSKLKAKSFSIVIAYGPAGDVQGSQVLGGVERALYELRQPRVVLGLARSLQNGRVVFQLKGKKIELKRLESPGRRSRRFRAPRRGAA